ncbi:hypothetical protein [Pedobacter miscanthi]|nr:hypothetical protein [Pedobacter miscanthi]
MKNTLLSLAFAVMAIVMHLVGVAGCITIHACAGMTADFQICD